MTVGVPREVEQVSGRVVTQAVVPYLVTAAVVV
jgi:hypothetical protein